MAPGFVFGIFFLASALTTGQVSAKECTNIPTELSSHTARAQLMVSKNNAYKSGIISLYHSTPINESAWTNLVPRKLLSNKASNDEFDWVMLYQSIMNSDVIRARKPGANFLKEVSLHDVRLDLDSIYGHAQQTNLEYLLMLDVDRLVWSFRKQAGLPTLGKPYGGWEAPDVELRGHFVGHYMSASAQMWASTHNNTLYEQMSLVVDVLSKCQTKMGTGYLSAFPPEFFDRFEAIQSVWAPYYTIHKIMAGLLDQYSLVGNVQALQMVVWMAEYFGNRVKNVILKYSIERHWLSLNEETGGMNDILYRLYSITGDQKHLTLAHLFDKPCFLGLLAVKADSLSGFHANTHIPVVIGAQMRYEVTGDQLYKEIGTAFMDSIDSSHSYATGGTSVSEFWSDPKRLADTLETENEESCTTYNMLKVSRKLFRWTKEIRYADYYERALMNGVLGIQRGREPGVMIYMLPMGRGHSKARSYHGWGTKFDSFWCCYGTGIESFSKLGDSIYFEEEGTMPGLYIIQFIPSLFNWKSGGVVISQKVKPITSLDPCLRVLLTISATESMNLTSTLNLRIPFWTSLHGAKAALNGQNLHLPNPGNFFSVTRHWAINDKLSFQLPIGLRTEAIKDDRPEHKSIQAILFGPYLLAGLSKGDWDIKTEDARSVSDWVAAVPAAHKSQLLSFTQQSSNKTLFFSNSNGLLTIEEWPQAGSDSAIHATFRVFTPESKNSPALSVKDVIGRNVVLEPFDLPGNVVVHHGPGESLSISTSGLNSLFRVAHGLDGKGNTISLESVSHQGCFVCGGVGSDRKSVQLMCEGDRISKNVSFKEAASFRLRQGMRQYHPITFMAKGAKRNFLLEPLLSLRDESYTVYFNIEA